MAALALACAAVTYAQQNSKASDSQSFDPKDFSGVWGSYRPADAGPRPPGGNFGISTDYDNKVPEPPLTEWAKQHLLIKGLTHDGLGPDPAHHDPNGVPTRVADGEYPGQKCQTVGVPALYNYTGQFPFEFVMMKGRVAQIFDYHREWRYIWLDRGHPKEVDPTYFGDSVAKWEGNTLVIDTIGYNGKNFFSENVGQRMSDAFHLVERWTRVDHDHMILEMTFYDPKAWGDQSWGGWKKYFKLDPEPLDEFVCSEQDYETFDQHIDAANHPANH